MSGDNETPERVIDEVAGQTVDAVRANVSDAASTLHQATEAAAAGADQMNTQATEAAANASQSAANVFGDASERLSALATPFTPAAFDTARQGGEAFGKGLQSSVASTLEGVAEFNSKAIAAWRANAESSIAHWQNLAAVKSLSEAIALSAEHTRKQMETLTSQSQELSALATRIVRDAADPLKMIGR